MDGTGRLSGAYVAPRISDYGTLLELTADAGAMAHVGIGGGLLMAQVSSPLAPGGGGGDVRGAGPSAGPAGGPDAGGPIGGGGPGGGDVAGAGPGGGGSGGAGGSGGELPFTGFMAAGVAAIGAGLSAAGLALRERLRRRH